MKTNPVARIDAICLDLDGTLYLQPELRRAMASRLIKNLLVNPKSGYKVLRILSAYREAQESLRGEVPGREIGKAQEELTSQRTGAPREVVAKCIKTWFEDAPLPLLSRYVRPGLVPFLRQARSRKIKLAVVSDYPAVAKLNALGVAEYFDAVVCAQDPEVQRFKPDPRSLHVALQRLEVAAENALYVGDRPSVDAEAAKRAGIRSIIVGDKRSDEESVTPYKDFTQLAAALLQ
jgi:phosphoglycolate phosphatase/putative hydrolase of the HAD superfamily